jgi:endonuclease/exonuclease/phosphatase family metal-dependent hydrolase
MDQIQKYRTQQAERHKQAQAQEKKRARHNDTMDNNNSTKRSRHTTQPNNTATSSSSTSSSSAPPAADPHHTRLLARFPGTDPDVLASLLIDLSPAQVERFLQTEEAVHDEDNNNEDDHANNVQDLTSPPPQQQQQEEDEEAIVVDLVRRYPSVDTSTIHAMISAFGVQGTKETLAQNFTPPPPPPPQAGSPKTSAPPTNAVSVSSSNHSSAMPQRSSCTISAAGPDRLRLLTWNVWFDPLYMKERMESIVSTILSEWPDIICLQEVTLESYKYLLNAGLHPTYKVLPASSSNAKSNPYFILILYREKTVKYQKDKYISYEHSIMGRGLLMADFALRSAEDWITIGTTHLESETRTNKTSDQRKEQLFLSTQLLINHNEMYQTNGIILLGDLNWKDPEHLKTKIKINDGYMLDSVDSVDRGKGNSVIGGGGKQWRDAWCVLKDESGKEKGYTLDGFSNGMLTYKYRTRLDRILYSSSNRGGIGMECVKMVGMERIVPVVNHQKVTQWKTHEVEIFPSDHYGLICDVHNKSLKV